MFVRLCIGGLPELHDLVHTPSEEVRADRALEVVHEAVDLRVGRRPIEVAALIGHVTVE